MKRSQAVQMRLEGYTFRDIAESLNVSLGAAHGAVVSALEETRDQMSHDANLLRQIEFERLELLWQAWLPRAIAGDVKALTALHRNSELRQRLMGLESSRKIEIENRLTQDLEEFVILMKGLLPEETFMEVARVLELAAERQNVPLTIDMEAIATNED